MSVSSKRRAVARFLVAGVLVSLAVACAKPDPVEPRTRATRPLPSKPGPYPNLASVPPRPDTPTPGVARVDEIADLQGDQGTAAGEDEALRAIAPVPPPLPAGAARPSLDMFGIGGRQRSGDRGTSQPGAARQEPAVASQPTTGALPAVPDEPPPPVTVMPAPGFGPARQNAESAPVASAAPTRPAVDPARPALTVRFAANSSDPGLRGLAQLDSFAQVWASTGRGPIEIGVRGHTDLAKARVAAVIEGLRKAGVPVDVIATGRVVLGQDVVELWREPS